MSFLRKRLGRRNLRDQRARGVLLALGHHREAACSFTIIWFISSASLQHAGPAPAQSLSHRCALEYTKKCNQLHTARLRTFAALGRPRAHDPKTPRNRLEIAPKWLHGAALVGGNSSQRLSGAARPGNGLEDAAGTLRSATHAIHSVPLSWIRSDRTSSPCCMISPALTSDLATTFDFDFLAGLAGSTGAWASSSASRKTISASSPCLPALVADLLRQPYRRENRSRARSPTRRRAIRNGLGSSLRHSGTG